MSKSLKISAIVTAFLITLSFFSYREFSKYSPKITVSTREVRGTTSGDRTELPFPENYELMGESEQENERLITYKTTYTVDEIQRFYKNILSSKDWEVNSESSPGIFTTTEYRLERKSVIVTTSRQEGEGSTIVSLTIKD